MNELKVNFGAGSKKIDGYVSVDLNKDLKPDIILDLNKTPYKNFKDCSVDIALWDNVLEHLNLELPKFVAEMHRILKPSGVVEIISPNCFFWKNRLAFLFGSFRAEHGWHINHSFLLKPSELKRYFELNGFEVKFKKSKSIWNKFSWINNDLFLQEIHLIARKRH